jgi:phosphopantothenoylcysteine synthetase/decarboxylase
MNIVLGITGGIAAYKTPELVRRLRERGADVQIVMTASAEEFVTPTSLQAVSGRPIRTNLWDKEAEASMSHIELARWADLVLIAPATAEVMARLAGGGAPDLLTTLCLATEGRTVTCSRSEGCAYSARMSDRRPVARKVPVACWIRTISLPQLATPISQVRLPTDRSRARQC